MIGIIGFILSNVAVFEHPLLLFVEFYSHMLNVYIFIIVSLCFRI